MSTATIRTEVPTPRIRLRPGPLFYVLAFAILAFLVLYPVISLVVTSFQVGIFGGAPHLGLENWREAFSHRQILDAIGNTLSLSFARQLVSLVFGVALAWMVARTNLPGRDWIEFGFWVALFMPALPVTMAWILLAAGRSGILNAWLMELPFIDEPVFDIYSWWGIIWVHLMTATLPVKVFLLAPAFRNMDASLEEGARTCGSGLIGTIWRIVVPIMLPTIVVVILLGMIRSMQAFEIELILGTPRQIDVYSTIIYRAMGQEPPLHGVASVLSISFLAMIAPFVVLQQWFGNRHRHATLSGKFSPRLADLGAWKWPLFSLTVLLLLMMTVLPIVSLVVGSFMKIFGNFDLPNPWTLRHWDAALSRTDILRALSNTLLLGLGSAAVGMAAFATIAYLIVKTSYMGLRTLDFLTWLPTVVPGIVISLGLLQMFAGTSIFRPFYGTMWVLILAVVLGSITVGVQIVKGSLIQLNRELEEASLASGASRFYTFFRIVLPLVFPTVIVVGLQVFATAVSVVGIIALLGTGANQPLSILQLVYMDSGRFEAATIVGIVILAVTLVAALIARVFSARTGVARHR